MINLINPFGRHFCRPCDRRHIVAQWAGDELSLTPSRLHPQPAVVHQSDAVRDRVSQAQ